MEENIEELRKIKMLLFEDANKCFQALEAPSIGPNLQLCAWDQFFIENLGLFGLLLREITGLPKSDSRATASALIFGRGFNSLVAAFHLTRHGFFNECYNILRMVFESINLIDLFFRDIQQADIWLKGAKLTPVSVRKKLGKRGDTLYAMLSEISHINLESVYYMADIREMRPGEFYMGLHLGGMTSQKMEKKIDHPAHSRVLCLMSLLPMLSKVGAHYSGSISDVSAGLLKSFYLKYVSLFERSVIPLSEKVGLHIDKSYVENLKKLEELATERELTENKWNGP